MATSALAAWALEPPAGKKLNVVFKVIKPFYDVTGPLEVAVRLANMTGADYPTGENMTLDKGAVLRDKAGNVIPRTGVLEQEGRKIPTSLKPSEVLDRTIDLRTGYPSLTSPGCYTLTWEDPRLDVRVANIRIAPVYDKAKDYVVTLETAMGPITLELFKAKAPNHVSNFVQLARSGFYDGLTFHRIIDGFMIQGGDPKGDGTGDAGYRLAAEISDQKHERGALAMARAGDLNSASCQFYLCLAAQPTLDGKYTVFGKVTSGMEVVDKMGKVPTSGAPSDRPTTPVVITKVTVTEKGGAAATSATAPAAATSAAPAKDKP